MTSLTPRIDLLDSYPNLAINGDFELWQRGLSIAVTNAAASYLADRNQFYSGAAATTATITQSTDVPTFAQSNYRSKFSMLLTTTNQVASPGANATVGLSYKVEGYDYAILHGKPFRVQRWFKSSVVGTYAACFTNSAQDRSYVTTFTINQANTWERKVFDLTGDTAGTWLFDSGIGLQMIVILQNNSAPKQTSALNTWQTGFFVSGLTQANLWAGTAGATFLMSQAMVIPGSFDAATELTFRRTGRTIQQELAMCQRYYYRANADAVGTPFGFGFLTSTSEAYIIQHLPVSMRIAPTTFAFSALTDFTIQTAGGTNASPNLAFGILSSNWSGRDMIILNCSRNSAIGVAGDGAMVRALNTNAWTSFDTEL